MSAHFNMMDERFNKLLRALEAEQQKFIEKHKNMPPPKYKLGDVVAFEPDDGEPPIQGMIEIVDRYGTFEQNEEPSYDIYRFENNTLYKHIRQRFVKELVREGDLDEIEKNIQNYKKEHFPAELTGGTE